MDRIVSIFRVKKTGIYLLHPLGTFQGFGGYVAIYPYRDLASDSSPERIGDEVVDLLRMSCSTGYKFQDILQYTEEKQDTPSEQLRQKYFARLRSTRESGKRYAQADVLTKDGKKSWIIRLYSYDEDRDTLVVTDNIRVKHSDGSQALGEAIMSLLSDS